MSETTSAGRSSSSTRAVASRSSALHALQPVPKPQSKWMGRRRSLSMDRSPFSNETAVDTAAAEEGRSASVPRLRRQRSSSLPSLPAVPLLTVNEELPLDTGMNHADPVAAQPSGRSDSARPAETQRQRSSSSTRRRAFSGRARATSGSGTSRSPSAQEPASSSGQLKPSSAVEGSHKLAHPAEDGSASVSGTQSGLLVTAEDKVESASGTPRQTSIAVDESAKSEGITSVSTSFGPDSTKDATHRRAPVARAKPKSRAHRSRSASEQISSASTPAHRPRAKTHGAHQIQNATASAPLATTESAEDLSSDMGEDASLTGTPASSSAQQMSSPARRKAKSRFRKKTSTLSQQQPSSSHSLSSSFDDSHQLKGLSLPLPLDDAQALEEACKMGCGRLAAPPSSKGRVFNTCCRNCAKGAGHSKECNERDLVLQRRTSKVTSSPLKRRSFSDQVLDAARHQGSSQNQDRSKAESSASSQRSPSFLQSAAQSVASSSSQKRALSAQARDTAGAPRRRSTSLQSPGMSTSAGQQPVYSEGGQLLRIPSANDEGPRRSRARRRSRSMSQSAAEDSGCIEEAGRSAKPIRVKSRSPRLVSDLAVTSMAMDSTSEAPLRTPQKLSRADASEHSASQRPNKRRGTAPSRPAAHEDAPPAAAKRRARRWQTDQAASSSARSGRTLEVASMPLAAFPPDEISTSSRSTSAPLKAREASHSRGHSSRPSRSPRSAAETGAGSSVQRRFKRKSPVPRSQSASAHSAGSSGTRERRQSTLSRSPRPTRRSSRRLDGQEQGSSTARRLRHQDSSSRKSAPRERQPCKSDPAIKAMELARVAFKRQLQQAVLDNRHEEDSVATERIDKARLSIAFQDWRSYCAVSHICSDDGSETDSSSSTASELKTVTRASVASSSSSGSSSHASVRSHERLLRKERDEALLETASNQPTPRYRARSGGADNVSSSMREDQARTESTVELHRADGEDRGYEGAHHVALQVDPPEEEAFTEKVTLCPALEEGPAGLSGRAGVIRSSHAEMSVKSSGKSSAMPAVLVEYLADKPLARKAFTYWITSSDLVKGLSVSVVVIFTVVGVLSFAVVLKLTTGPNGMRES